LEPLKSDLGYWMGWAAAFGIAGAFFIFIVSQEPSLYTRFCSPDETNCGREWVSAMGGWAGVVVAAASVVYLSRQIADANRHHVAGIDLARAPNDALARNILAIDATIGSLLEFMQRESNDQGVEIRRAVSFHTFIASKLADLIDQDSVAAFETHLALPTGVSYKTIVRDLRAVELLGQQLRDYAVLVDSHWEHFESQYKSAVTEVVEFIRGARKAAKAQLAESARLSGRDVNVAST